MSILGMVDYQHVVPVHAAQRKKRNWNELEPSFGDDLT